VSGESLTWSVLLGAESIAYGFDDSREANDAAWDHQAVTGEKHPPILMAQRVLPPIGYALVRTDGKRIEGLTAKQCGVMS
jgi:hypothetical protein